MATKPHKMSKYLFVFLTLGIFATGCKSKETNAQLLHGQWTLKEGFRNNKASSMLDGIFLNIDSEQIETNYLGQIETGTYELEDDNILISTSKKTKFQIVQLTENNLELKASIMGIPFRFIFEKKKD